MVSSIQTLLNYTVAPHITLKGERNKMRNNLKSLTFTVTDSREIRNQSLGLTSFTQTDEERSIFRFHGNNKYLYS